MFNRLNSFLSKKDIISNSQFGFLKNKSTVDATVSFLEKISNHSSNSQIISIFCDLTKAFDRVDHNILLRKLHNIGIRGLPQVQVQVTLFALSLLLRHASGLFTRRL